MPEPLTPDELASINEFFWSQFEEEDKGDSCGQPSGSPALVFIAVRSLELNFGD